MRTGRRRVRDRRLLLGQRRGNVHIRVPVDGNCLLFREFLLVLTHFVHFAVDVWRRSLTVAHAAANAQTTGTLEVRIFHARLDLELLVQLLQAKDSFAVGASHSTLSLPALRLAAKMTRLHQTSIFRFIYRVIRRIGRRIDAIWVLLPILLITNAVQLKIPFQYWIHNYRIQFERGEVSLFPRF